MNPADYKDKSAGRVARHRTGYWYFVPSKLPPVLVYSPRLALALSRADTALSELNGVGRLLPNPHLLIGPLVRREAVLSSRIEGTQASLADLLLEEAKVDGAKAGDVREVHNYVTALEHGLRRLATLPLSQRLVLEIHDKLMKGVRGEHATPGQFRRSQNWIGPPGSTLADSPYVPPSLDEMGGLLADWEEFLHVRNEIPDLIQCAIAHEQFEAIHPFLDGNGRVGRLLVTLFLIERERLRQPLLYLSDFIERHRRDYYELLQGVRTEGRWEDWLLFFLRGVYQTARDAAARATTVLEMREAYRRDLKGKASALQLLDLLFENPYVTIQRAAEFLKATAPTAGKAVEALEHKGILKEVSGRQWRRVYLAEAVLKAFDAPAGQPRAT
jgi:Fic family protein